MTPSEAARILRHSGLRPPRTLTVAITSACNLACRHCWVNAGKSSSLHHVPERILRRIIEEFVALGGEGVRFTGGEPLCHPAWLKLLQFGRAIGLKDVSIQTNAMLLTDEAIEVLRELDFPRLSLQISLDGATASTHDLVRGKGAFAGALAGVRRVARRGLAGSTTIFFTEMRHNLGEIPDVLRLADDLEIGAVVSGTLVLCGRAANEHLVAPPEPEQYQQLLRRFDADPEFRQLYGKIGTVAALEWRRESAHREEFCTFVENPYLTADGILYPCVLCHADRYAVRRVFGKNLAAVFAEGAPLWSSLMEVSRCRAVNPACRECPGMHACAGGCMGRAWGSRSDLLAVDDRCEVRRDVYLRTSFRNSCNFT